MDALARVSDGTHMLAEAKTAFDALRIADVAEAYRYMMKMAGASEEAQRGASELKLRAERRAGELLRDMPKAGGAKGIGKSAIRGSDRTQTYKDQKIDGRVAARAQKLATIPIETFEQFIATAPEISTAGAVRLARHIEREVKHETPVPAFAGNHKGRYPIIYCDPPWSYNEKATGGARWAGAENHYPCMDLAEICALTVQGKSISDLAAEDAVLFLWATFALLPDALAVIGAWDFEYKTAAFIWIKKYADNSPVLGLGNYTRQNAEVCLLARRGKGIKRRSASVSSVIESPRMEHSRKPACVRDRIVELLGDLPRIELFGREKIECWDVWGNEAHQEPLLFKKEGR